VDVLGALRVFFFFLRIQPLFVYNLPSYIHSLRRPASSTSTSPRPRPVPFPTLLHWWVGRRRRGRRIGLVHSISILRSISLLA
jgi:hypothetical protein